jgi:hypothetical protein
MTALRHAPAVRTAQAAPSRALTGVLAAALCLGLAGCMGGKDKTAADAAAAPAASGPVIKVDGVAYAAELTPTQTGSLLSITRPGTPMSYDEGALAKQVATQFCAGRGKRLAPWALGKFNGLAWVFDGGCA